MNTVHTTNYKLYKSKINEEIKICIISDIHFCHKMKNKRLNLVLNKIKDILPSFVMIPGDLLEGEKELENINDRKRLLIWLKELSKIAKILISVGNHDYYNEDLKNIKIKNYHKNKLLLEFFKEISKIPNIIVLNNTSYEDDKIFVTGFTQDILSLKNDRLNSYKTLENKSRKYNELNKLIEKNKIPSNKLSILLIHSPVFLNDKGYLELLKKYDYFVSGHMHNGIVPPILYELWNTSSGIISPDKFLFPKLCRNTLKSKNDKLIVNGPVTVFHDYLFLLSKFNIFYPTYMTVLDFTKDNNYDTDEVYVKRLYK